MCNCVSGAQLLGLQDPANILVGERLFDDFSSMAVNDVQRRWIQRLCGSYDVCKQRTSRQWLQDLGKIGLHSLTLACGQDDNAQTHVECSVQRGRCELWLKGRCAMLPGSQTKKPAEGRLMICEQ